MKGIDKFKQQLADAREIEEPKTMSETKSICDELADLIKEAQRQNTLEQDYTRVTRKLYLQLGELDKVIQDIEKHKTRNNVAEYDRLYDELLTITNEQQRLYAEISKYRTITPEQEQHGFL